MLQKEESPVRIQPGYYSFQQLADIYRSQKISISVNETNGRVTLSTPSELKISKRLKSMLGFQVKGRFFPKQTYQGDRPLDFAVLKYLYVHLSDINESHNYHNGSPSDVLAVIPIENKSFGDIVTVRFEHPELKRLKNGAITELKLIVKDEKNNGVDNHGLPMNCVKFRNNLFFIFSFIVMSIFGVKRGRVVDEDILSNATLNMDGKRIINVAYPRNPVENSAYNGDVVTAKALSDFRKYLLDEVLLRNSDNVMDGRLEWSGHKIKGLGNPVDSGDAVNIEYITAGLKAVTDELNGILERINKLEKNKTIYIK